METKYLRVGVEGQTTDIVNVTLVGTFLRSIVQFTLRKSVRREIDFDNFFFNLFGCIAV